MASPTSTSGKVVLITGCSEGGIGFHLCEEFVRQGCVVFATARSVSKMAALGDSVHKLRLDVTSDEDVSRAVQEVMSMVGRIDILVNNAGVENTGPLLEMPMPLIASTYDTNLLGVIRVTKAAAPHMIARKSGLIINVSSIAADIPTPWSAPYTSSKAALNSLSDILDMELRPFNVQVMLLCTGLVRSKIADNFAPNLVSILTSSPYAPYADLVANRLHASQDVCMATTTFARGVVKQALKTNPPSFFSYGSNTATAAIMRWLPRGIVLNLSWNVFAKHAKLFGRIIKFIP